MQKITIRFFLICLMIVYPITAISQTEECDEPDAPELTRVYYTNGIFTKPNGARNSKTELEAKVGSSSTFEFGYIYNAEDPLGGDLLEAVDLRYGETVNFWSWFFSLHLAPEWFQELYAEKYARPNISNDPAVNKHVFKYNADLRAGKKVVIVAHSQGNLFANLARDRVISIYPDYADSIGIVSVGTPSSYVSGGGYYTTNKYDLVINLFRIAFGDILPANPSYGVLNSVTNHFFVDSYLAAFGPRIRNHVLWTANRLKTPAKDFECEEPEDVPVSIGTLNPSSIGNTSVVMRANVIDGKEIDVWFNLNEGLDATSCAFNAGQHDGNGAYNKDDIPSKSRYRLLSGRQYTYRACAKNAAGQVSDGGRFTFSTTATTLVSTISAVNVLENQATIRGYVNSGSQIDVWFVSDTTSAIYCSSSAADGIGNAYTGQSYSHTLTGRNDKTTYYYRFCGKDSQGNVSSGAVLSFKTRGPALSCGGSISVNGASTPYSRSMLLGDSSGTSRVDFETYSIPDRLVLKHKGNTFYDTGYVQETYGSGIINFVPDGDPYIEVNVYPAANNNTRWVLEISCPN